MFQVKNKGVSMNYIEETSKILEVNEKELKEFTKEDTFNNNNIIHGVLCRRSDYRYGSMILFKVNEKEVEPQIIYGTPKLEYPFNKNGVFIWPEIKEVEIWDKLDGTNILSYKYYDIEGKEYLTYKTRLGPIISDTGYGSFLSMWKEMLSEHDWISKIIRMNPGWNLSFELYGSRNPITVKYNSPLLVKLLFGVRRKDHVIRPPSQLNILYVPLEYLPEFFSFNIFNISDLKNVTNCYEFARSKMSMTNKDELLTEGMVFYAQTGQPSWRMFKCKPDEIQKIHWSASGVIHKREIWNTAINAFEDVEPDLDYLKELLKEEYTEQMIYKSKVRIDKIFKEVIKQMRDVKKINNAYIIAKENGFDLTKDKAETFRFLSKYFKKEEMKKVGTILLKQIK
jgi:hypothetical protein